MSDKHIVRCAERLVKKLHANPCRLVNNEFMPEVQVEIERMKKHSRKEGSDNSVYDCKQEHKKLTDREIEKAWFDNNAIFDYNIFARAIESRVRGYK